MSLISDIIQSKLWTFEIFRSLKLYNIISTRCKNLSLFDHKVLNFKYNKIEQRAIALILNHYI